MPLLILIHLLLDEERVNKVDLNDPNARFRQDLALVTPDTTYAACRQILPQVIRAMSGVLSGKIYDNAQNLWFHNCCYFLLNRDRVFQICVKSHENYSITISTATALAKELAVVYTTWMLYCFMIFEVSFSLEILSDKRYPHTPLFVLLYKLGCYITTVNDYFVPSFIQDLYGRTQKIALLAGLSEFRFKTLKNLVIRRS